MITFAQVLELAETWIRVVTKNQAVIMQEHTVTRPYGWVFIYQNRAYVDSRDRRDMLIGNAPILVDRVNGEIRVFGTGRPLEDYLRGMRQDFQEVACG
jgi:hypothetical protein